MFHWTPNVVEELSFIDIVWWSDEAERIAKEEKKAIERQKAKTRSK